MFNVLALGGMAASLLVSPVAAPSDDAAPPPASTGIGAVTVNGSGCPSGTATAITSRDGRSLTVTYDGYYVWRGDGAAATDFRRNCQISMQVTAPEGYTYSISSADYRGFAYLAEGATATQIASYYFQGSSNTTALRHNFTGPMSDFWHNTDSRSDLAPLGYAPCGQQRNLNVNTELRVAPGTSDPEAGSFVTMDSTVIYRLVWQRCPASS